MRTLNNLCCVQQQFGIFSGLLFFQLQFLIDYITSWVRTGGTQSVRAGEATLCLSRRRSVNIPLLNFSSCKFIVSMIDVKRSTKAINSTAPIVKIWQRLSENYGVTMRLKRL